MTAVEWFANQLGITSGTMLEQAKEMERLQLADAQSYAISNADMTNNRGYFDCDKWYAETYGGDETLKEYHIVDTNEMVDQVPDVRKMVEWIDKEILLNPHYAYSPRLKEGANMVKVKLQSLTSSQTEISDEEIIKYAQERYPNRLDYQVSVFEGAKWYREQLKIKQ